MSKCQYTQPHAPHLTLVGRKAERCPGVPSDRFFTDEDIAAIREEHRQHPAPVDWPARFRTAADVAEGAGWDAAAHVFGALGVKAKHSPDEVEAIVRALLGEDR